MAVNAERVTVGTTATALNAAEATSPLTLLVKVPSAGSTVDLGGSGVTAGAGFAVAGGESVEVALGAGDVAFGIIGTGTQVVHVLRTGVG